MYWNLSSKYGQKPLGTTSDALKISSKAAMQKKKEAIGDLVENNFAEKNWKCYLNSWGLKKFWKTNGDV